MVTPALISLLKDCRLKKIDIVIVLKLDRLFRSIKHLVETLQELDQLGVKFIAINDNIDMTTASGRLIMHIIGAFAEFEAALIRERVTAGVRAKIAKTGKWGRPHISEQTQRAVLKLRSKGHTLQQIASELEISKTTALNYCKEEARK